RARHRSAVRRRRRRPRPDGRDRDRATRVLALKPGAWGGVEAVADEIRKRGRRVMTALADVRSTSEMAKGVTDAPDQFGRIDVLVNNAGAPGSLDKTPVVELPEEQWDTVLDTNLKGTFITSQAVARAMLERRVRGR